MADTKITALGALTGAATADGDLYPVVDISDVSMAATGTNKKQTRTELKVALGIPARTLLTPPLGANDYEFDASTSSLPAGYSWVDQGGSTYAEGDGTGVFAGVADAGHQWRLIVRTVPSDPWTITGKLHAFGDDNNDDYYAGVVLRASGSGKLITFARHNSGVIYIQRWTNSTTYSADLASWAPATRHPALGTPWHWRIIHVAPTDLTFQVSFDGRVWFTVLANSDQSAWMTSNQVGLGSDSAASIIPYISVDYLRFT